MALNPPFVPKPDTAYMEVPRCDQCTHWQREDVESGICLKARDTGNPSILMWAEQYDGIFTAPNFGCVQWEAK